MLLFAHPNAISMISGAPLVVAGEFLRLWGVAIAGSETRTTGPVGGTYLITTGPFAYVRNPLYVGNVLLYLGSGIMANALFPWLALAALIYFLFQYSAIVSLEEEYLAEKFKEEFVKYRDATPRFLPRLTPYGAPGGPQPPLDWKSGFESEKRTLQAIGILAAALAGIWALRG